MKYVLIVLCLIAAIAAAPFAISFIVGLIYLGFWVGVVLFICALLYGLVMLIWGAINGPAP